MRITFHHFTSFIATCLLGIAQISATAADEPKQKNEGSTHPVAPPSSANDQGQLEREKAFGELMSGAVLEGHFTLTYPNDAANKTDSYGNDGKSNDGKLGNPEKYTLGKVTKIKDDLWNFETRIQYNKHDVTLPLAIRVVWSGDTPVITLDKFAVPGFGTFTCRVMVFNHQYAGMWDGGNHGGLLFGKIGKPEKDKNEK